MNEIGYGGDWANASQFLDALCPIPPWGGEGGFPMPHPIFNENYQSINLKSKI